VATSPGQFSNEVKWFSLIVDPLRVVNNYQRVGMRQTFDV